MKHLRSFPYSVVPSSLMLLACAGAASTTPRSRVALDLGCTTEGTNVQEIEPLPGAQGARWQVSGCGRTAVYVCTRPVRDCWREGEILPASRQPPP